MHTAPDRIQEAGPLPYSVPSPCVPWLVEEAAPPKVTVWSVHIHPLHQEVWGQFVPSLAPYRTVQLHTNPNLRQFLNSSLTLICEVWGASNQLHNTPNATRKLSEMYFNKKGEWQGLQGQI